MSSRESTIDFETKFSQETTSGFDRVNANEDLMQYLIWND